MPELTNLDEESKKVEIMVRAMKPDNQYSYNLFDEYGNMILEAHVPISESLLNHLRSSNIEYLFYDPAKISGEGPENVAGLDTAKSIVDEPLVTETVEHVKNLMEQIRELFNYKQGSGVSKFTIDESRKLVNRMMENIEKNDNGVFNPVTKLKELDDYTYLHSTNVSILSAAMAARMEFKKEIRMAIGLGGLFHDMGKASVAREIVTKAALNDDEFNILKGHPHVGYKLIETNQHLHDIEKRIVLLHHERADGEGYPFGFELDHYEDQVPREIRLFTLCNEYVLMVQNRPGARQFTAREALRTMLNQVYAPYKKIYSFLARDLKDFVKSLGFIINRGGYFVGAGDLVRINTGEIGIIEEMNKISPLNPKVRLLKNSKMETLKRPIVIDMLKDYTTYISNVYDKTNRLQG